ncbi:glycosyltransferase [Cellulomonas fengjieae]|uniref:Glycosyltransferase n=1 Tax=Cellulomonas fengjieae TaxID=2819978 RepID=A0ABS3SJ43_9CELL|nr:glycosyltransferase [Cellulomonas fengjieae]MBO3085771.1 glycosyltransferase [Cellulomonas fengjieae]QVI67522.1 glycosyltransferase [Cellulomonas fengjieae]
MRIAMVSEHASPLATLGGVDAGGQNVHVAALGAALARAGHEVDVYTRRDDRDLPERVELVPGLTVVHVPAGPPRQVPKDDLLPYMPAFGDLLAEHWSGERVPDVAHAHFWMSGFATLRAAAVTGTPVAQTFHALGSVKRRHQGDKDTSPPGRIAIESSIGRRVDVVVATCSDEAAELARLGVGADRVRVVPCGVDVGHFRPAPVVEMAGLPRTARFRLLCIGRLVERKGIETVIDALVDLPDAELVVAGGPSADQLGDDAEAARLLALAAARGVRHRVRLVGRVDHDALPVLTRSADVVVATPWYEPFGIVPIEAAACGVPVVGSAVGGLLDTVQDGRTGLLVPPRDPGALASALRSLLDDPDRRAAFGAAARRRAVTRYGWDRVAAQTALVYRTLARGKVLTEVAVG